jgi:hypothetical protein
VHPIKLTVVPVKAISVRSNERRLWAARNVRFGSSTAVQREAGFGQYRPFDTLGQIGDNVRQVLIARANSDGPRSDEKDATNDLLLALQDRCPDAY